MTMCEEVRAIVSQVASEGFEVAESSHRVLELEEGATLVGDELGNEGEDYD